MVGFNFQIAKKPRKRAGESYCAEIACRVSACSIRPRPTGN